KGKGVDRSDVVEDISYFVKQHVQTKNISIPDYMHNFVNYKIKRSIDSAFQGRIMREDNHFVLDVPKID
ncbi:unnamed protein product, partial [Didymodactylos carnosus]